jgi:septum formation protein
MFTLASTSAIRVQILRNAGLEFEAIGSGVDEEVLKVGLRAEGASPRTQADQLAQAKAVRVSQKRPGIVLGCDQILNFGGQSFDKVDSLHDARERLQVLRGKTHALECGIVAARDGIPIWRLIATPKLTMRNFSDAYLDWYLAHHGDAALSSVGCYQYEGVGATLFERVEGDFFSILGLPLLDVLAFLRLHDCAPA